MSPTWLSILPGEAIVTSVTLVSRETINSWKTRTALHSLQPWKSWRPNWATFAWYAVQSRSSWEAAVALLSRITWFPILPRQSIQARLPWNSSKEYYMYNLNIVRPPALAGLGEI